MREKDGGVKVWEGELKIPTYRLGPDDQNPPILIDRRNPIHPGGSIIYPYPIQECLTDVKKDRVWKAVFLENDYLRLTLLPDLGGHLLSALDKVSNEEAIYRNHVLKYARIGIRGAWVSGGIEWNFPNGHTVTTTSPIDCSIQENQDGSKTVCVGDMERVSRMRWSVAITLFPQSALFETEVRLFNRTFLPNRFWYWANSAIPASPGLEFVTTASKVMTLQDVMDYPVNGGVNIGWDKNHLEPQDLFSLNSLQDFVAWYNHDLERGMVNYARRTDAPGKKFYTWGNSGDGKIWTELLTDEDGPYAEMQSGRLLTMRIWEIMVPFRVETWKEAWYPIRKIGAPVSANRDTAFSLNIRKGKVHLGVHVTSSQPGAQLTLHAGDAAILSERVDLGPEKPYLKEIVTTNRGGSGRKGLKIALRDQSGRTIGEYLEGDRSPPGREIRGYIKIEPNARVRAAEERWQAGVEFEKIGDFVQAEMQYRGALEEDTGYSPAHRSLGILHLRRGNLSEALRELRAALERNTADDGARFFLGACLISMERFDEAVEETLTLSRSSNYGAAAAHLLGGLLLGRGRIDEAVHQIGKAHRLNPENQDTLAFLAAAYRKNGQFGEAHTLVQDILKRDPLNFNALVEDYFSAREQGAEGQAKERLSILKRILRNEAQSYLELATDYARFGLYTEAAHILTLYLEDQTGSAPLNPLLYFHLGYYLEKLGAKRKALQMMKRGGEMDHNFVFPHRIESETVLRRALEHLPGNGKVMYYLGNLLCSKDRPLEAIGLWERAVRKQRGISVIHRNLGRSYWKVLNDPDRAVKEYEKALRCDPGDYKLYYELDKLYAKLGLHERRQKLIGAIPQGLMQNDMIVERVAHFYTDRGEYDRALGILLKTRFFPWEFYTEGRNLYEQITIGKGIALMAQGSYDEAIDSFKDFMKYPRNIGVGEPYHRRHAEALYRMGLAFEKLGETGKARQSWEEAVREEHAEGDVLRYYQARALQKLGKRGEATRYLEALRRAAEQILIDNSGKEGDNLYLLGLAYKGYGDVIQARIYFKQALALDGSLRRCTWEFEGHTGE